MTQTLEPAESEQRFVLDEVDWEFYEQVLRRVGDRHVFVTYDRGRIELMSPSWRHDTYAELLGLLLHLFAEEFRVPIKGGGSTTFRRQDLDRGLEPDKCFYSRNESRIRGKTEIDLSVDPPPDLVVEIEVSRRLAGRLDIYAALGVLEVWRYDGKRLRVDVLCGQRYEQVDRSFTFPDLPLEQVHLFVQQGIDMEATDWMRTVRQWVRQHLQSKQG